MTWILDIAEKDFKMVIINIVKKVKENKFGVLKKIWL